MRIGYVDEGTTTGDSGVRLFNRGSAKRVPKNGAKARGQPATGGAAKGVPKTGAKTRGQPATGGPAKGAQKDVRKTGGAAKGVSKVYKNSSGNPRKGEKAGPRKKRRTFDKCTNCRNGPVETHPENANAKLTCV